MSANLQSICAALGERLSQRKEILFAILYGSAIEGGTFRDLDIGVFLDRVLASEVADWELAGDLADELSRAVSLPVDVQVLNEATLPFRYNVSRGAPLAVRDAEALAFFLERTWDDFLDFRPVAMQYLKELA
jgi:uncharacterized protein